MIIITGLGRCGTSFLTKYLKEVGYGIGKNVNWHKEARAGLELSTAYSLNRDMYDMFIKNGITIDLDYQCPGDYWSGLTFKEAINSVDKDERQGKVDVIKDPRFTWSPSLIEAWWNTRKDFKLIICHRRIEDIYKSRKSLPLKYDDPKRGIDIPNPEIEIPRYKNDFSDFITKVIELKIEHRFIYFPDFLDDYSYVWDMLNSIGLEHDYDNKKWEDMIIKKGG